MINTYTCEHCDFERDIGIVCDCDGNTIANLRARVERLETALREFVDDENWQDCSRIDENGDMWLTPLWIGEKSPTEIACHAIDADQ